MSLWQKLALLCALQLLALAAMVADKQWTLQTGTTVVLPTLPVDPRSLFMGDYARLNYAINRLALDGEQALGGDKDFQPHDRVWVAIQPQSDGAKALSVHHQRSTIPAGQLVLAGEVQYIDTRQAQNGATLRTLQVRYGIEQYFVPEGTGRQIEQPQGGEKVSVRVAIDQRGKAGILALLLDGRERYRETLF